MTFKSLAPREKKIRMRRKVKTSEKCGKQQLYLGLTISLWWDASRGVIDAIIMTEGGRGWALPTTAWRGVIHLPARGKKFLIYLIKM